MQTTLTGFKKTGSWEQIVEHGERITAALIELDVTNDNFDEWNEWRPKVDDTLHGDINKKTAEKATVNHGKGEQKGKSPNEDIVTAGKKLSDNSVQKSPQQAATNMQQSASYASRAIDTVTRKALRAIETVVYQYIMTRVSPYYFDNELISANTTWNSKLGTNKTVFTLEVNINDDALRANIKEILVQFESIDRWHLETPKNTATAEQIEGQDIPSEQSGIAHSVTQVSEPKEKHKEQFHNN